MWGRGNLPPHDDDNDASMSLRLKKICIGTVFVVWLTVCRAGLPLAVIAVVVCGDEWLVNVDRVGDGFAEAVTLENHFGGFWCVFGR